MLEERLLLWIHARATPALDGAFWLSDQLGLRWFCASLIGVVLLRHLLRREGAEIIGWVCVGLTAAMLPEALKHVVSRPRPALWPPLVSFEGFSFPSGHATVAAAYFPLLGWILGRREPWRRRLGYALGMGLTLFVGIGRMYLGVHWPTDVLAGWLLGGTLGQAAIYWLTHGPGAASGERRQDSTQPRAFAEQRS